MPLHVTELHGQRNVKKIKYRCSST